MIIVVVVAVVLCCRLSSVSIVHPCFPVFMSFVAASGYDPTGFVEQKRVFLLW